MHVAVLGMSYKTAPVEIRGRLAWTADQLPAAMKALKSVPGVAECAILSTCNRTEIYVVMRRVVEGRSAIIEFWSREKQIPAKEIEDHSYFMVGEQAVEHMMRVASGLDSMILGETQILGQVKDLYLLAQDQGTIGNVMHALFRQTIACGKRVHTETSISQNAVSVSYAAVELARKIFGDLAGHRALIVGAGKMAGLTAKHLTETGLKEILVCNRTFSRAEEMAREYNGRAVPWEKLEEHLAVADVVISSTGAPGFVITKDMIQRVMRLRRFRPLFLVDIAVPPDIDPAAGEMDNVFLYNIDDLEAVVLANLEERAREAQKAERLIIAEEVKKFDQWLRSLDVVPLIKSLREKVEDIRQAELTRLFNRLPGLTEREKELISATTALIVNKILNDPTVRVKEFANYGEDADMYVRAFSRLFNLEEEREQGQDQEIMEAGRARRGSGGGA